MKLSGIFLLSLHNELKSHLLTMKNIKLLLALIFLTFSNLISLGKNTIGYIPTSGGAQLYYEESGKGSPIILLHGHSLDTRMWDAQYKVFARNHRVVRFDFRGYGKSSPQSETFQFTHMKDLLTVMDSLHIKRAHIVGLSMGAFVAADLLALHPDRIISCTMASGGMKSYKGPSQPMDSAEAAKRDSAISALKRYGVERMKSDWLEQLIATGGSKRESMRKPLKAMIDTWTAWQPLHKEVRVIEAHDAEVVFRSHKTLTPTLILSGDAEGDGKLHHSWMIDYLPNGKELMLHDCGHMMNMEQPKLFNDTVLNFINKHEQ